MHGHRLGDVTGRLVDAPQFLGTAHGWQGGKLVAALAEAAVFHLLASDFGDWRCNVACLPAGVLACCLFCTLLLPCDARSPGTIGQIIPDVSWHEFAAVAGCN